MRITLGVVTSCFVAWSACASDLAVINRAALALPGNGE